jgi:hypothetical protein
MTAGKSTSDSDELLRQLDTNDPAIVLKALHKLEKVANIKDLPEIIRVMAKLTDSKLIHEFEVFLSNIRSKEAPAILAQFLADPICVNIRIELTRSCWESQLDYSPHLLLFGHLFIAGDFNLALEAFSVIENTCLERPVNNNLVREVLLFITNNLPDQPETKQRLARELIDVLEPFARIV